MENLVQYLLDEGTVWLLRMIGVVAILITFYIISKVLKRIIITAAGRLELDQNLIALFARVSSVMVMIFGFVTALGTVGVDVSALVAGLGLTGFALGFALKDTISNLLAGVLILLYQPFQVGDRIKISSFEGLVVSIDLRYTKLEAESSTVLIPNAKLFTDPITIL